MCNILCIYIRWSYVPVFLGQSRIFTLCRGFFESNICSGLSYFVLDCPRFPSYLRYSAFIYPHRRKHGSRRLERKIHEKCTKKGGKVVIRSLIDEKEKGNHCFVVALTPWTCLRPYYYLLLTIVMLIKWVEKNIEWIS